MVSNVKTSLTPGICRLPLREGKEEEPLEAVSGVLVDRLLAGPIVAGMAAVRGMIDALRASTTSYEAHVPRA